MGASTTSPERLLLKVEEAAGLLGIGRNLAYELVAQGRLPHVRLGRLIRIPRPALEEWIASETVGRKGESNPPPPSLTSMTLRH